MAYIGTSPSQGVRHRYLFTATSGQTTFIGSDDDNRTLSYTDTKFMDVFLNGLLLDPNSDYTATTGNSIVLNAGATTGDLLEVIAFDSFSVFSGNFGGDVSIDGALTVSSGNIDGVTIGGTTAGAGTFTAFTSNGIDDNATSNAVTIDASGNVGIGTSSPSSFDAAGDNLVVGTGSGNNGITVYSGTANASSLFFADGTGSAAAKADGYIQYTHSNQALAFATGGASERMRIDSSGNVIVGATSQTNISNATEDGISLSQVSVYRSSKTTTGVHTHALFINPNGIVGSIGTNASSTSFNTSSDYRLKEDIQPVTGAIERVNALNPVNFAWKADGSRVDGFLAHEAQAVVPEAVHGEKDAMRDEEYEVTPAVLDEDGNVVTEAVMGTRSVPDYQGIDQSKLVPLLTAALQEAIAKIENLESRLETLENA